MNCWIFAHNPFEYWMEGFKERFDAWHDGGVRGLVVGRMQFDGAACWTPDPRVYERFGESPPDPPAAIDREKERRFHAMLDDAAGRGWPVFIFGAGTSKGSLQDLSNAFPQVSGFIIDGPGENHYELAFHHGGRAARGAPRRGGPLRRGRRRPGPRPPRHRLHAPTPARADAGPGSATWRRRAPSPAWPSSTSTRTPSTGCAPRRESSRLSWAQARDNIDAVDRKVELGGIPRTAAFSSLTGQDYQQMASYFDIVFPKHYYWAPRLRRPLRHRGPLGAAPVPLEPLPHRVRRLPRGALPRRHRPAPGGQPSSTWMLGFPQEFFDETGLRRERARPGGRGRSRQGDLLGLHRAQPPRRRTPWGPATCTASSPPASAPAPAASCSTPDPEMGAPEWRVISNMCGRLWQEDPSSVFWPGDSARGDEYSGGRQPAVED